MDMKVCLILVLLFTENYCQKDASTTLGLHANDNVSKIQEWIHLLLEIRIPLERCFLQVPWNSIFSSKIFPKIYFKREFICYWKSEFHWKDVYKFHGIQFSIESVETVFSNNPKLCSPGSLRNTNCTVQCTWIFWNYIFTHRYANL